MEVWLDNRDNLAELSAYNIDCIDYAIQSIEGPIRTNLPLISTDGKSLIRSGKVVGEIIKIDGSEGQSKALSLVGSVSWLLLEFENWSMIPIENIIAACAGGPTKVAALLRSQAEAQGAAFALEIGVDALVVIPDQLMINSAAIAKSQRGEVVENTNIVKDNEEIKLQPLLITNIESGGLSDRYCIDLTSLLEINWFKFRMHGTSSW